MSKPITNPTLTLLRAMLAAPPARLSPVGVDVALSSYGPPIALPATPPKAAKAKRKPLPPTTIDLRSMANTKVHVRFPHAGPAPKTPASAAKLRRLAMMQCECRMCALALYPPTTFAEYASLGLREPSFERVADEVALFIASRPHTWAVAECFELMTGGVE